MTVPSICGRVPACFLLASLAVPAVFAGTITEPTATLPPPDGVYTLADTCIPAVCLGDITISNFAITSNAILDGDEHVATTATMNAEVFRNNGGVPGAPINPVVLTGTADFTFLSRSSLSELGTFTSEITGLDLTGIFAGISGQHTAEINLNPSQTSLGVTTVTATDNSSFQITSFFDVFTELSLDGGTFVPGPSRHLDLSSTPEPASAAFALAGCFAAAALSLLKRRRT